MNICKDKYFPFTIGDTNGVHEMSRNLHWHKEVEICHVKRGTGKYLINGRYYSFSKGDLFIINNDELHLAYDDCDLIMQVTLFDPSILSTGSTNLMDYEYLKPFKEAGEGFDNKLDKNHSHTSQLIEILSEIEGEYCKKPEGYELMIKSLLLKLMTLIIRYFRNEHEFLVKDKVGASTIQRLKKVADYIERYYANPIKLKDLSNVSQMSASHFSNVFQVFTGTSPMDYIARRRIYAAKELLRNTNKNILEIASESGFSTLSNFNRSFKIYTGVSPSRYRKS